MKRVVMMGDGDDLQKEETVVMRRGNKDSSSGYS